MKEEYGNIPSRDSSHNVHSFLDKVTKATDTIKTGNLTNDEIGLPSLPIRTYKELSLFCREVANMEYFAKYFDAKAEILTSTSLSKDAKLLNLAVIQKKEVEDKTKPRVENKGWFKKKPSSQSVDNL